MHDLLFENRQTLDDAYLVRFGEILELDVIRFRRELAQGVYREKVREDFISGVRSGVNGMPTFFINGIRHDGSWNMPSLLFAIERATESV